MNGSQEDAKKINESSETEATCTKSMKMPKSSVMQAMKEQAEKLQSFKESNAVLKIKLEKMRYIEH